MNSAQKTNLKKLTFLGFGQQNTNNGNDVRLDDECAKVFAMGDEEGTAAYDFSNPPPAQTAQHFNEQDYTQHRGRGYQHVRAPLKIATKPMRRGSRHSAAAGAATPPAGEATPPTAPATPTGSSGATPRPSRDASFDADATPTDSTRQETDVLSQATLREDSGESSGSEECVLSEPCQLYGLGDEEFSPERRVQFLNSETRDTFDVDGLKDRKRRRHHHHHHNHHHSKYRKYSLPDDQASKKRHHHHHHYDKNDIARRISTQPEDEELKENDRDQLDSHRSDDPRGLRRHKASRPSNASMVNIGKGIELHPSLKKLYDHSPHAIFVELGELLTTDDTLTEKEWKETARWIKYEEDVEEGVDRWGKPHVASLSFHSLLNLRKCLENGVIILDLEERDLPAIAYRVSEDLFREDLIREDDKGKLMRALLLRHRHVNEHHDKGFRFTKKHSYTSLQSLWLEEGALALDPALAVARCSVCSLQSRRRPSCPPPLVPNFHNLNHEQRKFSTGENIKNGDADNKLLTADGTTVVDIKEETYSISNEDLRRARNEAIFKKIPPGAQGSSVLVGEVDFLEQPAIAFVRLAEGVIIPSLIEVNIPVRFVFILLGPRRANVDYHEIGRSISTLMANSQFHNIAYKAESRKELLSAINEFLDDSIVLPPGDWERQALLPIEEIKAKSEQIRRRKENALKKAQEAQGKPVVTVEDGGDKKPPYDNPLERTRRPWGGLIKDLKRRYPWYKSDITDGVNAQCAAASIFMYFAAVSGAIAFGGLLGDKTNNQIGICETLLATSISGVIFAVLAGQPLVILGTTGPLLLFDESLYQFCVANGIEYLTTRVFIGLWLAIIAIFVASFEGSVLVKLFTRFTEDIFSALIVILYIVEAGMNVYYLYSEHPILYDYCNQNSTSNATNFNSSEINNSTKQHKKNEDISRPNTALFCTILTLGTFSIAYYLKMFRNSKFLGRAARRALGDFGVPIAIVIMVLVDYLVPQIYTDKLNIPEGLSPSDPDTRGWFISPGGSKVVTPVWTMFAAAIPAMLVYILLFMETHITELIIDKKERKLKKGSGFHLDIVLICSLNIVCGFFGFPWICAATVRSIAHTSALTVMSTTHAPGEKPHIIEVKEQRVSSLCVAALIGLSVLMSPLLRLVPMAVLFGIFLYMGIASTDGIQFFDRMRLFFMPVKHHPGASYVRKVRTAKMHLFTFIQLMCLICLWIVKSTKASLAFPFFLILMVPLRAQLARVFTQKELRALDGDQVEEDDDEPDFYAEAPLPG